jgi:hypothetical protein
LEEAAAALAALQKKKSKKVAGNLSFRKKNSLVYRNIAWAKLLT